jgi:hypothetical protein
MLTWSQEIIVVFPQSDPIHLSYNNYMGILQLLRYRLSIQVEDLDKSIFHLTKSILFPPHLWQNSGLTILQASFNLSLALVKRSEVSKLPDDAILAAKYLRNLRDQPPHQASGHQRHLVTSLLVEALAIQVELEAGDVVENIGEMAVLCHELLTLDTSSANTICSFTLFFGAFQSKLHLPLPDRPLEQIIECLRTGRAHQLCGRESRIALAMGLLIRYCKTFANDDYEEAASVLDEFITSSSPGDTLVAVARQLVTFHAMLRSSSHCTPEYSEEAIYRALSDSSSAEEPAIIFDPEGIARKRFRDFGFSEEVSQIFSLFPLTRTSLGEYFGFSPRNLEDLFDDDPDLRKLEQITGILLGILHDDRGNIVEAIEKAETILASCAPTMGLATSAIPAVFGMILFQAFVRTNKIEYLNESVSIFRPLLELPLLPFLRFRILRGLSLSLFVRSEVLSSSPPDQRRQDLDEALERLSQCVNNKHEDFHERCWLACRWASIARGTGHPSVSTAYESALSLIQDILLFAPTLQLQHTTLARSDDSHRMSLDYASYQVDLNQLEEAIVTLERGRALLWSEMRHFRTSIDQLHQVDPQLGQKFATVNRDLEELTKSIPPSFDLNMDEGRADELRAVDPFGRLLLTQRRLLKERDKLISEIQALPGFDSFLTSPPFDALRSAASSGPVIIINHSEWRSDILILLHSAPPSLIPTPNDFFSRASALKVELLGARSKHGPDSYHYNKTLAHVLAELYKLVGKPVIDRLRQLNVPEQSRVWWCPTSVFCSLPLHAMGPIPSDDGEDRYFLDLYIPSYTPTLSALIPASDHRDPGSSTLALPSVLLVAHFDVPSPDVSLSEVCEDVKVVEQLNARLAVKSLISEGATPTSVLDGLRDHQFVHFVCHGTLEAKKPFDAGFELHGNERLTLLDIVRSRLPAAEFAFLSACHTAELTEGSSADEGLHLAAAVQYCGFQSVVGTMWAMANEDGPDVAKYFYRSIFPKKENGELGPYYKRSARALRDAVKKLRKKRWITLERWVNFVHYGA